MLIQYKGFQTFHLSLLNNMVVVTIGVLNETKSILLLIVLSIHNDKSILFELIQFYAYYGTYN